MPIPYRISGIQSSFNCEGPLFNFVRGDALQNILIYDYSVRLIKINVSNK